MPNHVCWMCKAYTGHELIGDPTIVRAEVAPASPSGKQFVCAPMACSICRGQSIAMATVGPEYAMMHLRPFFDNARGDELRWRPSATESHGYPDVPPHISEAATEAFECQSSEHYRGAILLARAVIEATAKDVGITSGKLTSKIEAMAAAGLIRNIIKDAAHRIRQLGNDMAHGDFVDPVSAEESRLVIRLMGDILNDVYQTPAAISQAEQAVQIRRQCATDSETS